MRKGREKREEVKRRARSQKAPREQRGCVARMAGFYSKGEAGRRGMKLRG